MDSRSSTLILFAKIVFLLCAKQVGLVSAGLNVPPLTLPLGNATPPHYITFLNDQQLLLTADADGSATLWNVKDRAELRRFRDRDGALIQRVALSRAQTLLMHDDPTHVAEWSLKTGTIQSTYYSPTGILDFAYSSSKGLLTVGPKAEVFLWQTTNEKAPIDLHCPAISSIDTSRDGRYLAVICMTSAPNAMDAPTRIGALRVTFSVIFFDLDQMKELWRSGPIKVGPSDAVRFSTASHYLVIGSDYSLQGIELTDAPIAARLLPWPDVIPREDGITLITPSNMAAILCLRSQALVITSSGTLLTVPETNSAGPRQALAIAGDLSLIATPNIITSSVDVYDTLLRRWQRSFEGTVLSLRQVVPFPNGQKLVVSSGASLRVWNLESGREQLRLLDQTFYHDVVVSADNKTIIALATTLRGTSILYIDADTGAVERSCLIKPATDTSTFGFTNNGAAYFVAFAGQVERHVACDANASETLAAQLFAAKLAVSGDGQVVFLAGAKDAYTNNGMLFDLARHSTWVFDLPMTNQFQSWALSEDGAYLVGATPSGDVRVWNTFDRTFREISLGVHSTVLVAPRLKLSTESRVI